MNNSIEQEYRDVVIKAASIENTFNNDIDTCKIKADNDEKRIITTAANLSEQIKNQFNSEIDELTKRRKQALSSNALKKDNAINVMSGNVSNLRERTLKCIDLAKQEQNEIIRVVNFQTNINVTSMFDAPISDSLLDDTYTQPQKYNIDYYVKLISDYSNSIQSERENIFSATAELRKTSEKQTKRISLFFAIIILSFVLSLHEIIQPPAVKVGSNYVQSEKTIQPPAVKVGSNYVQSEKTIQPPAVKVGDNYIYSTTDSDNPDKPLTTKRTIISNDINTILFSTVNVNSKKPKIRKLYFDNEWNLISARNSDNTGFDYFPPLKYFDFPLYPGKTWEQSTTETNVETAGTRIHKLSGTVGQWENVSVPAGTFYAIKVVLQIEVFNPATSERINGSDTSWYVPEVHRSVKSITTGKDGKNQLIQLIEYKIANDL
ncbi:MAG: hypothetical protein HQK65_07665 [Desulfamplus sp.]|nr:hypothetical protein [Desulfamplus sp.]